MTDKVLLRIEEAAELLSLGRSKTYELVSAGQLSVVRIGRSVRVPAAAVQRFVDEKTAEAARPKAAEGK